MLPPGFAEVFLLLAGLAVGSFLNVCIHRLPLKQSVVHPGSRCPSCGYELRWYDNLPVLSYVFLRGRCRSCRKGISLQYPVIEVVTAVMFLAHWYAFGPTALLAARLVFGCALIVLFMIDLEHQILPNAITLPGIVVGLAFSVVAPPGPFDALVGTVLGGGVLYGIAFAYYLWRKEEGMGMGDVKMLAMIGAFLGWQAVLVTLVLSSFAGAVIGVLMMIGQRGTMRYALPFGTFLSLGALAAMLVGERLVHWYMAFFPV